MLILLTKKGKLTETDNCEIIGIVPTLLTETMKGICMINECDFLQCQPSPF